MDVPKFDCWTNPRFRTSNDRLFGLVGGADWTCERVEKANNQKLFGLRCLFTALFSLTSATVRPCVSKGQNALSTRLHELAVNCTDFDWPAMLQDVPHHGLECGLPDASRAA